MATTERQTFEFTAESEQTALSLLKQSGLGAGILKQAGRAGSVWISSASKPKRLRRLKQPLKAGDTLFLYYDPDILAAEIPEAICINDQNTYSVWFKPRGMFSQPSRWGDANSISRHVELSLNRPTYLVHRLDRMTSGLMLLAHHRSQVQVFTEQFQSQTVQKIYQAVVHGKFSPSELSIDDPLDGKPARSEVRLIRYSDELDMSLLEIIIATGRKHQIRRHLAAHGYPLLGDRLYGKNADNDTGNDTGNDQHTTDLQLMSFQLSFDDPGTGQRMCVQVPQVLRDKQLVL